MNALDFLTFLFTVIAVSFITVAIIDFITGLMLLWQTCATSPEQQYSSSEKPNLNFYLESETATEPPAPPVEPVPDPEQPVVTLALEERLQGVDIDTLQLRPARKVAKALGIAQKVNGKDQLLSWLRAQIETKLQQPLGTPETLETIRKLAS